jgi:aminoglycoside/choline kinase family phosphotransferase
MANHPTIEGSDLRERIDQYLGESGLAGRGARVVPLTGDASDRRYFRILAADGPSVVLALHAGPIEFASLPFANVADLLQQVGLPVPAVLGHSDALGIVALQDLGDVTLQAHLGAATPAEHAALYRQAVAFIELLQRRGTELHPNAAAALGTPALPPDGHLPYRMAFDVEKLTWELDFFVRHFVEGYRGIVVSASERQALAEEWSAIADELASEPRVLCHRDYHSRNLMLHDGSLYIIDFQDARMGPDTYDLASLLRDSYVEISEGNVDELIAYFRALKGRPASEPADLDQASLEFRRRFDLMSLQRNLKALGTFGYQTMTRRNPVYIQYMPRTLHYARTNLEKYSRFARLRELLAGHIEELQ